MASISSSENGGLASNEPLAGLKDRKGLKHNQNTSVMGTLPTVTLLNKPRPQRLAPGAVSPSGSEEAIDVGEGGAELFEVAVERRGETLESDSKLPVQRLEHSHRQRPL